jgi:hypothetical protein
MQPVYFMQRVLKILIRNTKEIFAVSSITLLITVLTTINLITQFFRAPADHVFVGLAHYWEDYYYYLDQFYQGAHGAWLTVNNFTIEKFPPTLIYFNHILLGKIGGLFHLTSYTSFNISVIVLKILLVVLSYLIIRKFTPKRITHRIYVFIIYLFSTSLPLLSESSDGNISIGSARVFRTSNVIMTRFGNVPDSLMRNVIFICLFLLIAAFITRYKKTLAGGQKLLGKKTIVHAIIISFLLIFLTMSDATKTAVLLSGAGVLLLWEIVSAKSLRNYIPCILLFIFMALPSCVVILNLYKMIDGDLVYQAAIQWDINENLRQLKFLFEHPIFFIISYGTLGIFSLIGLHSYIKKEKNIYESYGLVLFIICFVGYLLPWHKIAPVPSFRFLFPVVYIFAASIAFQGFLVIERILKKDILLVLLVLYLIPNVINFSNSVRVNSQPLKEPNFHFAYLPTDLYKGLNALESLKPKDAIVIANPHTSMDILIPGLTGKKTYSGHILMTLNEKKKDVLADAFIYKWTDQKQAAKFMKENDISYLFLTSYDGDADQIKRDYKFLTVVYENPMVTIFMPKANYTF